MGRKPGREFRGKEWKQDLENVHQVSRNTRYKYTQFNYLHTTYLTPHRLNIMMQVDNLRCPRCALLDADFVHMVWGCPIITQLGGSRYGTHAR